MAAYSDSFGLHLEEGELPASHAQVTLEDFIKAPSRAEVRRRRGGRSPRPNLRLETQRGRHGYDAHPKNMGRDLLTERRGGPPPEFVPAAKKTPFTPQHVQNAGYFVPREAPFDGQIPGALQSGYTTPQAGFGTQPSTKPETPTFHESTTKEGTIQIHEDKILYDEFGTPVVGRKLVGEVGQAHVSSFQAFWRTKELYRTEEGDLDEAAWDSVKAHAYEQMLKDGQIAPVQPTIHTPHSAKSSQRASQKDQTPTVPPGLQTTPQQFRLAGGPLMPTATPQRTVYNPFTPQAYGESGVNDPFISPLDERHTRGRARGEEMEARTTQNRMGHHQRWSQSEVRRSDEVEQHRSRVYRDLSRKRGLFGIEWSAVPTQPKRQQPVGVVQNPQEPRRTVLHDPLAKQREVTSATVVGENQGKANAPSIGYHHFAQPRPSYQLPAPSGFTSNATSMTQTAEPSRTNTALGHNGAQFHHNEHLNHFAPPEQERFQPKGPTSDQQWRIPLRPSSLQSHKDARAHFDYNKTEEELRNPFGHRQTGEPPFWLDDTPPWMRYETREQRVDRIWYDGQHRRQQDERAVFEYLDSQEQLGKPDAELAASLMIPFANTIAFYSGEAEKRRRQEEGSSNQGWASTKPGCDFFARVYDPFEMNDMNKVVEWLTED